MTATNPREQGITAFQQGVPFNECHYQGFREDAIELRWQWQKGWLHAQRDQQERERQTTP